MKRNNRTGSHLFFIEFIIVLFFFLIVSTVCLRLFARAHGITQRADALSHAQTAAASVAAVAEDILSGSDTEAADSDAEAADGSDFLRQAAAYLPGAAVSALPDAPSEQEGLVIFYDKEFQTCTAADARYMLAATVSRTEHGNALDISVTDYDHVPVYELSVAFHRPITREEALQ